jgi:cell division septal protein FtsQ
MSTDRDPGGRTRPRRPAADNHRPARPRGYPGPKTAAPRVGTTRAAAAVAIARPRPRSSLTRQILLIAISKLIGLAVLFGLSGLMYDLVSSPEFSISRVTVAGNGLLTAGEVEAAASASGLNVFWVRRAELVQRLQRLPAVESAEVSVELPDHLRIRVREREPMAIWLAGDTPYLVDRDGLILAARPPGRPLMTIRDTSNQVLSPGSRVSPDAVRGVEGLDQLLNRTFGGQPRQYEYAAETGLNVTQQTGPRLIFGSGDGLETKVAVIQTIVQHLQSERKSAEVIDVRFGDRPYYR